MTTQEMHLIGFSENGINNFIRVIESVMPHLPGNWEFRDIDSKLNFISENKQLIYEYIDSNKPEFTDEELEAFNWFNNTDEAKIKRLSELQSASVSLRSYF